MAGRCWLTARQEAVGGRRQTKKDTVQGAQKCFSEGCVVLIIIVLIDN